MPRKPKPPTSEAPLAPVPSEILDQFVRQGPLTPEELDAPPFQEKPSSSAPWAANSRTTSGIRRAAPSPKRPRLPRDRQGTFEPRLIGKHERRFTGFDDKVLALYARGMTVREIQAFPPRCTRWRSRRT